MPATAHETWVYTLTVDTPVAVAGAGSAMFTTDSEGAGYFFGPTSGATLPAVLHDADAAANESLTVPAGKYLYLVGKGSAAVTAETPPA